LGIEIKARAIMDSARASTLIKEQKFDVIFLDVGMPPPDGIELTMRIRSSDRNRTTPIVIITGAEDRGLMTRAFQAGANWFLFKPVDRAQLLHLIQISRVPIERERRRLQRVKVKCKVSIESERSRLDGETLDLSLSGMLVHTSSVLPVGSSVKVILALPAATTPIRTAARIVRVIGNDFMGVEFEHIGKVESEKLGEFLVPLIVAAVDVQGGKAQRAIPKT
jgi:CheY-like chemotaxis protein